MDQIMNKAGAFWFNQKANKEISSVGDDFDSFSSSVQEGASWLVNKLKGKMQKSLPQLLQEYDLPIGIFPKDATNYEFSERTGKITVFIPRMCEIGYKDTVLRYATVVTGSLEKGKLTGIEGVKTKFLIWVKVTSISTEGSKVYFNAGMKKSKNKEIFQHLRNGITVDKF